MKLVKPKISKSCRYVDARYDPKKEWRADPKGYFLIRLNQSQIEAAFCKKNNLVLQIIRSKSAEKIYNTIIKKNLVTSLQHACYLGYELCRAEHALKLKKRYLQDDRP